MARTIFIGDVHGCDRELGRLLEALDPAKSDRIILLGDVVNKGPDSVGVVSRILRSNYECLLGNHEWGLLQGKGKGNRFKKLAKELGPIGMAWVSARPLYIEEPGFIAVHAGFRPGLPLSEQKDVDLLTLRTMKSGKGRGVLPWHAFYRGRKPVCYGHWAVQGHHRTENTIGLDSGCVYGGKLSGWILEEDRLVQVAAEKAYRPID